MTYAGQTPAPRLARISRWIYARRALLLALAGLFLLWRFLCFGLAVDPASHDAQDAYTLQALAWRMGRIDLPEDQPALELAYYNDCIYVSFPPVPSVVMWALTFVWGAATPNRLALLAYFLLSVIAVYGIARSYGRSDTAAAFFAVFVCAGCSLLPLTPFGGTWYQAQALSFALTLWCFRLLRTQRRAAWQAGLVCIALAVGCRPFQAVYAPVAVCMLWKNLKDAGAAPLRALPPYLIAPLSIAAAYGVYNFARFGNPFEFGHTYLPEFQRAGNVQFSLSHVLTNVRNLLQLPYVQNGRLDFPRFGFAFYLANPIFPLFALALARAARARRATAGDAAFSLAILLHVFLLLLHRTFGGWQFGARYLIDAIPACAYLLCKWKNPDRLYEGAAMLFAVLFNVYGTLVFHLT